MTDLLTIEGVLAGAMLLTAFFSVGRKRLPTFVRHYVTASACLAGIIAVNAVRTAHPLEYAGAIATVVVKDSHGTTVTVAVDLRHRIVTSVYSGPQLSAALTQVALDVVHADPRTSALLARGATIGRISPIEVTYQATDPTTGQPSQGTQTWAQVPLQLDGGAWSVYLDLPQARVDQLIDPNGNQVPPP